jgi:hypothetical protein
MAKFDKETMQKSKLMVANLKSTGQSKFALDDAKEEVSQQYPFDNITAPV